MSSGNDGDFQLFKLVLFIFITQIEFVLCCGFELSSTSPSNWSFHSSAQHVLGTSCACYTADYTIHFWILPGRLLPCTTLATSPAASQQARQPLDQGIALVGSPLSSQLSGWLVFGVVPPLSHRRSWRCNSPVNDLDNLHNFSQHKWYVDYDNLLHDALRRQFLRDHFDTSHNLLLDLKDCHVYNLLNGALFVALL